jgi:hypothetical protein
VAAYQNPPRTQRRAWRIQPRNHHRQDAKNAKESLNPIKSWRAWRLGGESHVFFDVAHLPGLVAVR